MFIGVIFGLRVEIWPDDCLLVAFQLHDEDLKLLEEALGRSKVSGDSDRGQLLNIDVKQKGRLTMSIGFGDLMVRVEMDLGAGFDWSEEEPR